MKVLKILRNYLFYCGIEKEEYEAIKKDVRISNYVAWRVFSLLMVAAFAFLYVSSLINDMMSSNQWFYLIGLAYSVIAACFFFRLKKDSAFAQLIIYLSISLLFLFACLITQNKPNVPATTFIAFLLIVPMSLVDKPVFMTLLLGAASTVFLVWMHNVKPYEVWQYDLINVIIFTIVGIFLNIIADSVRIREFVLRRKINIQKDTDELTGLKNKGALIREINEFLADESTGSGIMYMMDVDKFKSINDTFGHDIGDDVIVQLGSFLGSRFTGNEITGRFGGDEFVVFIPNDGNPEHARAIAADIVSGASEHVVLPTTGQKLGVSVGVAVYSGLEKEYSELFKKADTALYRAKADPENRFCFFE
jgi:diguanylate cyclase (GGDEF) domain